MCGLRCIKMSDENSYVPPMMISGFRGEIDPVSGERLVYFGIVRHIPYSVYGKNRKMTVETEIAVLQKPVLGPDGTAYVPAANHSVERYESLDPSTGDIWIMYRSPFYPQPDQNKSRN